MPQTGLNRAEVFFLKKSGDWQSAEPCTRLVAMSAGPQRKGRKSVPSEFNQSGADMLETVIRTVMDSKCGKRVDLVLPHKQKGTLVLEFGGTREEVPIDAIKKGTAAAIDKHTYSGNVDLKAFFVQSFKVRKGKLEVSFCVADSAIVQQRKQAQKSAPSKKKKSKGGSSSRRGEPRLVLQRRSALQVASDDITKEVLACLTAGGFAMPEGKEAASKLQSDIAFAIKPALLSLQNKVYARGLAASTSKGPPPSYCLYEKPPESAK